MAVKSYKSESLDATIEIDNDKCTGAGECIAVCPAEVFELVDGKATVPRIDDCTECCACVEACPNGAIKHSTC